MRSMFAAVSGLRAHQTMMDVVANNISNVNTPGYKAAAITFQEALSQILRGPGTSMNPLQLGLGVKVASIDPIFTQGATQVTGRTTDVAIQGDGFFIAQRGTEQLYTRAGSFSLDAVGNLVAFNGYQVLGWLSTDGSTVDPTAAVEPIVIPIGDGGTPDDETDDLRGFSISDDGSITGQFGDGTTQLIGKLALASFSNAAGLVKAGNSYYSESVNSGTAQIGDAGTGSRGLLSAGALEMSNVDLGQEFTNLIIAQRGFQANSRVISASDELLSDLVNLKR
jgi:flagellar hook protein FlgE